MRKLILSFLVLGMTGASFAKNVETDSVQTYVRSSLYTIILDNKGLMDDNKAEIIKNTFFENPLPDKYNDHNLDVQFRTFNPSEYGLTDEELAEHDLGKKKKKKGGFMKKMTGDTSESSSQEESFDFNNPKVLPYVFGKYFDNEQIANQLVAKWFNSHEEINEETGSFFDMELIKEKGLYNASEMDKELAAKSVRGISMLADAGENLIKNTFVVGIRFNYVDKEEVAGEVAGAAKALTGLLGKNAQLAGAAVEAVSGVVGRGYVIKATAFLFQLDWNDEVANNFYKNHYMTKDFNSFMTADNFKLNYIGSVSKWADIQSTVFSKKTDDELVARASIRATDAVIAKLQREFEVFRAKTPILTTEPEITAQIGLKEGLEGGDKFEVLEKVVDPKTNLTSYKRVTVLKVDKHNIWDNRYAANEEKEEVAEEKKEDIAKVEKNATVFKGSKGKIYPGMLIRQID